MKAVNVVNCISMYTVNGIKVFTNSGPSLFSCEVDPFKLVASSLKMAGILKEC